MTKAKPKSYFVRIRPYNKKRGCLVRNYTIGGVRFTTRWKEVSAAKARELASVTQPHDPEAGIPLFEIRTRDEALKVEADERDAGVPLVARVRDAERVPDKRFRDDRPQLNDDGEFETNYEPAEVIEKPKELPPITAGLFEEEDDADGDEIVTAEEDSDGEEPEGEDPAGDPAPAPSLRATTRTRS